MRIIHGKGKLFLYGMGAMGVNMLNLVIGSYLCDALMVEGFETQRELWTFADKTLIVAAVWSVIITIAKIVDGVIDIPLAAFSDNLQTKWGRRRPAILMGLVPMMAAYVMFLNPVDPSAHSLVNTIWCGVALCLFYSFYTLTMGTYYATFAEIVDNDADRVLLSNFKTIFDVIYFILGYALIPLMISMNLNIRTIGYIFLPLALTMLIPIFMIKEPSSIRPKVNGKSQRIAENGEEHVSMIQSLRICFQSRNFIMWMVVYAALQFGLQMFITGQNVYYSGTMMLGGGEITILMAAVFAPVPLTLILYNHFVKKKGLRFGFLFSLSAFMIAMVFLGIARPEVFPNHTVQMVVAVIGTLICSFGIGCFFSISYTVPSALADADLREKGVSHPTMFFALQGLSSGIATAIATGLVWVNLKDNGLSWTLPIAVLIASALAVGLSFLLPRDLGMSGTGKRAA